MELERRIAFLDRPEQVLVPSQRQIRVVSPLQQELHAADGDGLVDLSEDFLEAEHVAFGRAHRPVERAEVALRDAHVRVVHVAIDDVGDDGLRVLALPHEVGQLADDQASAHRDRGRAPRRRQCALPRGPCRRCNRVSSQSVRTWSVAFARQPSGLLRNNRSSRRLRHHVRFHRVSVEQLEPCTLFRAEMVLDIIPKISGADLLARRRAGKVLARRSRRSARRRRPAPAAAPARRRVSERRPGRPRTHTRTASRSSPSRPRRDRSFRSADVDS